VLDDVDAVWLLGPSPPALLFALEAKLRRRALVLGVRQDTGAYLRSRHPGRRWIHAVGALMEGAWRLLARRNAVVVVGPELAQRYRGCSRLLTVAISLVRDADLAAGEAARRDWDGEIELLSVGRLETEKNPLLLADVLARLHAAAPRWRLNVAGEGPLHDALAQRLEALGVADRARLLGYLPLDGGLLDAYRSSHVLLHVSWTEGLPQILFEAFAAGLPVVATDVGGIRAAVGDATELVPRGDAEAAARALERVVADAQRRAELVAAGFAHAREHTLEAETARVADFVMGAAR
jgi:glycosyltransferase involved in cell wall biosynthesis